MIERTRTAEELTSIEQSRKLKEALMLLQQGVSQDALSNENIQSNIEKIQPNIVTIQQYASAFLSYFAEKKPLTEDTLWEELETEAIDPALFELPDELSVVVSNENKPLEVFSAIEQYAKNVSGYIADNPPERTDTGPDVQRAIEEYKKHQE